MIHPIPKNTDPTKVMTEQEFARAYIAARQAAGDSWSTLEVVRSWHAYQKDPAGHFLSNPKVLPSA